MWGLICGAIGLAVTVSSASPVETLETRQGGISSCCFRLRYTLGDAVAFKSTTRPSLREIVSSNTTSYEDTLSSYWSAQAAAVSPNCIVTPRSSSQVADVLKVLKQVSDGGGEKCLFAIKSGGHTPWAGAANIEGGVTVDLSRLSNVTLNTDRTIAAIGPGAKWVNVYDTLSPLNLSVTGGRASTVGVGGLVTGGGMSFFAPRYGFACDNVHNFEVVLASGETVNANATSNADLWYSLKGGSNNFGIVTRIDMRTFAQNGLWGGYAYYPFETAPAQLAAFEAFAGAANYDTNASLIHSYAYAAGQWIIANNYVYTQPVANPAAFKTFTDITPQIPLGAPLRITNLSTITMELDTIIGGGLQRNTFATGTFVNDAAMLGKIFEYGNETLQRLLDPPVANMTFAISFQPLPTAITSRAAATGGNALGLDPDDGPLVIALLTVSWTDPADDDRVDYQAKKLFELAGYEARRRRRDNDWIYLNYAAKWQSPIKGYGADVARTLADTSKKYDPEGVFQRWVPGGFKLNYANSNGRG
ncbi:MAG: hypothetical protein M1817_003618 [Caeruleum heppii]|nr:MAG: hypothetical protein M1817_003618 [Caeruleum heppii]